MIFVRKDNVDLRGYGGRARLKARVFPATVKISEKRFIKL